MQFKSLINMKINFNLHHTDLQLVPYKEGKQLFWYKHKVDINTQKVYWVFQHIGLKKNAKYYEYEFEIQNGSVQKFKVTDFCKSEHDDLDEIMKEEKCVVLSFTTIKNYLNEDGELSIRFRIQNVKHV